MVTERTQRRRPATETVTVEASPARRRFTPPTQEESRWQECQERNEAAMVRDGSGKWPLHSCSVDGHTMAQRFGAFIRSRVLGGRVLDIGCGPQPVASYLADTECDYLAGIDPIDGAHPFDFHQGYAEELPYEDGSFTAALFATSLGHVCDPARALAEAARVVRAGGWVLVWETLFPTTEGDTLHPFHLTTESLTELLSNAGLTVMVWQGEASEYAAVFVAAQKGIADLSSPHRTQ